MSITTHKLPYNVDGMFSRQQIAIKDISRPFERPSGGRVLGMRQQYPTHFPDVHLPVLMAPPPPERDHGRFPKDEELERRTRTEERVARIMEIIRHSDVVIEQHGTSDDDLHG